MSGFKIQTLHNYKMEAERAVLRGDKAEAKRLFLLCAEMSKKIAQESAYEQTRNNFKDFERGYRLRAEECDAQKIAVGQPMQSKSVPSRRPDVMSNETMNGFDDIAGLEEVKRQFFVNVIYPLKYPSVSAKYQKNEDKTLRVMLYGPPGTGKTLFARTVQFSLNLTMHKMRASDIVGSLLGESSKKLDSFLQEVHDDPSDRILIFIDEFDAIAKRRSSVSDSGGAQGEMDRLVNTLLQGVDDLVNSNSNKTIVFLVTTNLPWTLDPAIMRGQRFDTQIYVPLPDAPAIKFLVEKHMSVAIENNLIDKDVDMKVLVERLVGYSAADIVTICRKLFERAKMRIYEAVEAAGTMTEGETQGFIEAVLGNPDIGMVKMSDIEYVMKNYRNSVTEEMMLKYQRFMLGEEVV